MQDVLTAIKVVKVVGKTGLKIAEKIHEVQVAQLCQSVDDSINQKDYEQALPILKQLIQKVPQQKAYCFYEIARCLFKLKRYDEALQNCEFAIQSYPDEELLQDIYTLKTRIKFGTGFWIQWFVMTVFVGIISLFGTFGMIGNRVDQGASALWSMLAAATLVGFTQWLLVRMRTTVSIRYLIANIVAVLSSLAIAVMALSVNPWLGVSVFFGCTIIFMLFSVGRLAKQINAVA
jgi:tetratricopeptide (TPR) repeat protein